ncbi:hypothetical protein GQ43DRAFT_53545 [Delitschia confertaspora ATCC 74209]|uniref:Uncharacterized protein n=1 Tax=Delitschia confertaspora ATCC 74209 TaxID=1513339 RepID=A0A9P4JPL7_9PLEO|nr:hypothetical protein GQ43DRAFT_53545 [Delitschia confertaspora ATCC 74209]
MQQIEDGPSGPALTYIPWPRRLVSAQAGRKPSTHGISWADDEETGSVGEMRVVGEPGSECVGRGRTTRLPLSESYTPCDDQDAFSFPAGPFLPFQLLTPCFALCSGSIVTCHPRIPCASLSPWSNSASSHDSQSVVPESEQPITTTINRYT